MVKINKVSIFSSDIIKSFLNSKNSRRSRAAILLMAVKFLFSNDGQEEANIIKNLGLHAIKNVVFLNLLESSSDEEAELPLTIQAKYQQAFSKLN